MSYPEESLDIFNISILTTYNACTTKLIQGAGTVAATCAMVRALSCSKSASLLENTKYLKRDSTRLTQGAMSFTYLCILV